MMKKIIALMIALIMVVSMFAACADKNADDNKNDPPAGDTNKPDENPGNTTPGGNEGGNTTPGGNEGGNTTPGGNEGGNTTPGGNEGGNTTPDDPQPPVDTDKAIQYTPTIEGFVVSGGTEYGWGDDEYTLDFTDSKIERVEVSTLDATVAESLTAPAFANKVLKLAGVDTFELPEFNADTNADFFKTAHTYTITINYLAVAGSFKVVAINGDTTRDIATVNNVKNSIEFDYVPEEGDTAIAFVTEGEDAEIYLGKLTICLYDIGPSYNQLVDGYSFNFADFDETTIGGTVIQVKDIEDADVKEKINAAGFSDDHYINVTSGIDGATAFSWHPDHFEAGRKYKVSVTYYAKSGNAGYMIIENVGGGPANHTIKDFIFSTKGSVATASFNWEVKDGSTKAIYYLHAADVYVLDINIQLDVSIDYHYDRNDVPEILADDMAAEGGYTFDMSRDSIPVSGNWYIDVENLSEELQSVLVADNGFGATVLDLKGKNGFHFDEAIYYEFEVGVTYRLTMRVWADGDSFNNFYLLPFGSNGAQVNGLEYHPETVPVEGLAGVYDVVYTFTIDDETIVTCGFYAVGAIPSTVYIGSINFSVAPEETPEA